MSAVDRFKQFATNVTENCTHTLVCCQAIRRPPIPEACYNQLLTFFDYRELSKRIFHVGPPVSVAHENWEKTMEAGVQMLLAQGIIRLSQLYREYIGDKADPAWRTVLNRIIEGKAGGFTSICANGVDYPGGLFDLRNAGAHELVELGMDEAEFREHHKRMLEVALMLSQRAARLVSVEFDLGYPIGTSMSPEDYNKLAQWFSENCPKIDVVLDG